jgi:hypothetical protein
MAIINTIDNGHDFVAEFAQWEYYKDCFSIPALYALYIYLDELSNDIGEDIELDVVGICCEFAEYKDIDAVKVDYGFEVGEVKNISELQEKTTVIEFDGGLVISQF